MLMLNVLIFFPISSSSHVSLKRGGNPLFRLHVLRARSVYKSIHLFFLSMIHVVTSLHTFIWFGQCKTSSENGESKQHVFIIKYRT